MIQLSERVKIAKATEPQKNLQQWWNAAIALPEVQVQVRLRGNNMYVLCAAQRVPEQRLIRARVIRALLKADLEQLAPAGSAPVYQVNLYGKAFGHSKPDWVRIIYLNQLQEYARKVEAVRQAARQQSRGIPMPASDGPTTAVLAQSNRQLAQQGHPDAIARQLSEFLSQQGIAVRAGVKALHKNGEELTLRRLVVYCEAAYSPDPTSLIEPIAQRLRRLGLTTFRDAVIYGQVQGESDPEWKLRIDLTPQTQILQEWARWGDVEAMVRLANQALAPQHVQASGIVQDMILHLTCWRSKPTGHEQFDVPPQQRVMKPLLDLFEQIAPQGVHALLVSGTADRFSEPTPQQPEPEQVAWRDRCDLPAASHPQLALTTDMLARQGDLGAIGFSLTRVLNADLDQKLATGGWRVQARHRADLLHVMVDGAVLPAEKETATLVGDCARALKISGVNGVRIYGRRAGEKRPRWKDGCDFTSRERLVPEATPEFAASDAYVGDLITQQTGALLVRPDLNRDDFRQLWSGLVQRLRTALLGTQVFAPLATSRSISRAESTGRLDAAWFQELRLAAVWGALGIVATVCADQSLGFVIPPKNQSAKVVERSVPQDISLSGLTLSKSSNANISFNQNGFTGGKGRTVQANRPDLKLAPSRKAVIGQQGQKLLSSPVQPRAQLVSEQYQFKVPQLNQKLALYEQFVAQSGVPDILLIGSSRTLRGIDPVALRDGLAAQGYSGRKVFNFGVNGATAQMVDLVLRRLLPPEKLPKLIVWADGARAFNSGRVDVTYNAIAQSESYAALSQKTQEAPLKIDPLANLDSTATLLANQYKTWNGQFHQWLSQGSATYHRRSQLLTWLRDSWLARSVPMPFDMSPERLADVTNGEDLEAIDVNGFLPLSARFNPTTYYQKFARVTGINDADYTTFRTQGPQTDALKTTAEYLQRQQSKLVFVNLPLSDQYLDSYRRKYEAKFQQFMIRSAASMGFTYRNLSGTWQEQHDYFSDPSHLNRYGAYAVSQQLATDPLISWGVQ